MVARCCLLRVVRCLSCVVCGLLRDCSLFVARCLILAVRCWLLAVWCLLFVVLNGR